MIKKVVKDEIELGKFVSDIIEKDIRQINKNGEKYYLGLATGSTPIPVYKELVRRYKDGDVDFFNVATYNLDEYVGLTKEDDQSYYKFMVDNLFSHVNIREDEINFLDGMAEDLEKECKMYDEKIEDTKINLQILGIGENGHIAFNEPSKYLKAGTHVEELSESTINANSRFFENIEDVPKKALSMGIKSIFNAKKIVLIARGKNKAKAVSMLLKQDKVSSLNPSSLLLLHNDVVLVLDEECYNEAYKILEEE